MKAVSKSNRSLGILIKDALEINRQVSLHRYKGSVAMKVSISEMVNIGELTGQMYPDIRLCDVPIRAVV